MRQVDGGNPQRHFTQAARDAALARRRELAALPKEPAGMPRLFVTRGTGRGNEYGWEIRRYGALVVKRSDMGYPTEEQAREAGRNAISALGGAGLQAEATPAKSARPIAIHTT